MKQATLPGVPAPEGSVGDVNSQAKGSGARFNGGKPPYDLVPIRELVMSIIRSPVEAPETGALEALACLAGWQETGDPIHLYRAMVELGFEGWAECASVFDYGRHKYAAWNWAKGMAWSIPLACAVRHLLAMIGWDGLEPEELDRESKKPHRGHVFCNICMLLTYTHTFPEGDDRPRTLAGAKE